MRLSVAHLGSTSARIAAVAPPPVPTPVLTGSIAPVVRTHDGATPFTVATAAQFSGAVTTYVLASAPPGVTINPATGQVAIGAFDYAGATIGVRAENASGASDPLLFTVTQTAQTGQTGPWPISEKSFYSDAVMTNSHVTPAGVAGDTFVIFTQSNGLTPLTVTAPGETVQTIPEAEQIAQDNWRTQVDYLTLSAPTTGLTLTTDRGCALFLVLNIGPHTFHAARRSATGQGQSSSNAAFDQLTGVPARSKVFYLHGVRVGGTGAAITGTGALTTDPVLPSMQGEYTYREDRFLVDAINLEAGGTTPAATLAPGSSRFRGRTVLAFAPAPALAGSALPGQYIASGNGPGLARSSTLGAFAIEDTTFTLAAPAQVGHYMADTGNIGLGEIWVRPTGGATTVTITGYTPGYGVMADNRLGNGAMLNPPAMLTGSTHGYDNTRWSAALQADNNNQTIPFSAAQVRQVPITMAPGDVLVVARSRPNSVSGDARYIENFMFVHCVADVPFDDEFAPPPVWHSSLGPRPRYRYSMIDETLLPSLATAGFPATIPDISVLMAPFQRRLYDPIGNWQRYGFKTDRGAATYGRDYQQDATDPAFAYIGSDQPVARKRRLVRALVQRGIDAYGVLRSAQAQGFTRFWTADGGHNSGRKAVIVIGGHLLGDATMRDWVRNTTSVAASNAIQEDGMYVLLTPAAIAATQQAGWQGAGDKSPGNHFPYQAAMGVAPAVPEWTGGLPASGIDPSEINNTWDGNSNFYRTPNGGPSSGQIFALLAMGLRTVWDNEAQFHYAARHHALLLWGDDPWRYVGGAATPRYDLMNGAPSGTAGVTTSFTRYLYDLHAFRGPLYTFPAGVNPFNGAT